ncbi:MAG: Kelch repeat-containing protein [Actinomycetota bacterium]
MPDLKDRFSMIDQLESPELWSDARRRAMTPDATSRSVSLPPDRWKRAATAFVAFAVFAAAAVFAWNLSHPERAPRPRPRPAFDLATELPSGWSELPAPPEVRSGAVTAWTGSQLLVWGGYEYVGGGDEDPDAGGFAFDAASRRWSALPDSPLRGRSVPAFAWTGSELLIWGGWDGGFRDAPYFADGAAFDPAEGTWRMLPPAPIAARTSFSAWTGSELIVWGSTDRFSRMRDGAAYDPQTDTWRTISEAPVDITDGSAVWSGEEMIVFGAALDGNNHADTPTAIAAAYDPAADTWRELPPSDLSPQAMTAEWLDGELIAWDYENRTAAYDPSTNTWRALPEVPLSFAECGPDSVATAQLVFGNYCGQTVVFSSQQQDAWHREPIPDLEGEGCCRVMELAVAGDVVLVPSHSYGMGLGTPDRRMFVYNPPAIVRTDARGEVLDPEPFFPRYTRDGDDLRMPVVFPDGSRATLVFPIPLGIEMMGVQPDVAYYWTESELPHLPILFLHDTSASIRSYIEGEEPLLTMAEGTEIWPMSEKWKERRSVPEGVWIRLQLGSWTVLVASTSEDEAISVMTYLHVHETQSGFPVVDAAGPLTLAEYFGESEGPQLGLGDTIPDPWVESDLEVIYLAPTGCSGGSEASLGYAGSSCLADGDVYMGVYGDEEFVLDVIDEVRIDDFRPA